MDHEHTARLAELLAAGERAAFHGRPDAGIEPLRRALEVAAPADAESAAATWLLGVCLAACGRYGSAMAVLEPLARTSPTEPERALFASFAAASLASVARQLGRHSDARRLDQRALDLAGEAPEARFDAALGLASDAVGLGELEAAEASATTAIALAEGRTDWWRQRVRLDWVRSEIDMLRGDSASGVIRTNRAISLAETSGAPRHVAKGLLLRGVAQVQAGSLDEAVSSLRRAATLAESLGAAPLAWPAWALIGALTAEARPSESATALASARAGVRTIADDLPPPLAQTWLERPDIVELLAP
ncbi:unannotated protein [freshwater metagenome]|uniref:Unannotated protein n=1 Tax=freshwater metagenome TaxID=449393 RepID=A0A6J7JMB1_9ZZZZ|nr:hypothetical protein [Actinomycetota bacterium]MSW36846.1 hypothetical protein [Actinomycetota bacterium]